MEFDRTLAKAEALLKPVPVRNSLTPNEIERVAEYYYAEQLAEDEDIRLHGTGSEPVFRALAAQLAGVSDMPPAPEYGLTEREMRKIDEYLDVGLDLAKHALARGDISHVEDEEEMDRLLAVFRLT